MYVYIRHIASPNISYCGEMNPEQLHHFMNDVRERGIYDGEEEHPNINLIMQYVNDDSGFYVDIVWEV